MTTLAYPPEEPNRLAAAVLSVAMHMVLFIVLIAGVSWQSRPPEAVMVELWQPAPQPVIQAPPPPKPERAAASETGAEARAAAGGEEARYRH
jgi:hypothetical protein